MSRVKYKLWLSDGVINEWSDAAQARTDVLEYYMAHEDEAHLLHFGAFKLGTKGRPASPVFSVTGADIIEYLNDVQDSPEDDEWIDD